MWRAIIVATSTVVVIVVHIAIIGVAKLSWVAAAHHLVAVTGVGDELGPTILRVHLLVWIPVDTVWGVLIDRLMMVAVIWVVKLVDHILLMLNHTITVHRVGGGKLGCGPLATFGGADTTTTAFLLWCHGSGLVTGAILAVMFFLVGVGKCWVHWHRVLIVMVGNLSLLAVYQIVFVDIVGGHLLLTLGWRASRVALAHDLGRVRALGILASGYSTIWTTSGCADTTCFATCHLLNRTI